VASLSVPALRVALLLVECLKLSARLEAVCSDIALPHYLLHATPSKPKIPWLSEFVAMLEEKSFISHLEN
jgi:hypothetical protein